MTLKHMMPSTIFREYDIRGIVDQELFIDQMYDLARAIAYFFVQRNSSVKTVAVAMDGRTHSPIIKDHVVRAFQESGLDVLFIGLCPSPAIYFAMHTLLVDAGIIITASHNPKEYNGVKIMLGKENVSGVAIQEIYNLYKTGAALDANINGSYKETPIVPQYVDWLAHHFKHLHNMQLHAIVDCGNGAAGAVMPLLVQKMGWQHVQLLYAEVDGTYPHHEADPTVMRNMQDVAHQLQATSATVGVGFDGDADRMAPMTKSGRLVPGDLLLGLFAQQVMQMHNDLVVVCDIKASVALVNYMHKLGVKLIMAPSGHTTIKKEMRAHHALLAGELSCHFFFKDRYFGYDDGIYAMLRLFELVIHHDLDRLLEVYPTMYSSPEFRIACDEDKKRLIVQTVSDIFAQKNDATLLLTDGVRAEMPYGWGLLRASNTQPVLSLRFESETEQGLERVKHDFIKALAPFYAQDVLMQELSKE